MIVLYYLVNKPCNFSILYKYIEMKWNPGNNAPLRILFQKLFNNTLNLLSASGIFLLIFLLIFLCTADVDLN